MICCNLHQPKPSVTQNRWESSFQAAVITNVFRTVTIPSEISQQTSFIVNWCNDFNAICTNIQLKKKPVTQNQWGAAFLSFCCYKTLQNCDNSITTISRNKSLNSMTFSRPKLQLQWPFQAAVITSLQNCDNVVTTISRNKFSDSVMMFSRPRLQLKNATKFV